MMVPLSLFPEKKLKKMSKIFRGYSKLLDKNVPNVKKTLIRLDSKLTAIEYFSIGILNSCFLFVTMFALFLLLGFFSGRNPAMILFTGILAAFAVQGVFFSFLMVYPKILFQKKKHNLERDLPFALRYLMVQVSSGVPLYNAIADIATTRKNEVSKEFEKIIKQTQKGIGLTKALEDNATKNPSHFYKRAMLQISNASRSGTDIAKAIGEVVKSINKEQRIAMKIYSSQLNLLTMIYMLLTIILPTLGIVLLVVLSNFVAVILSLPLYLLLIVLLVLVQYLFVGLIESRRPIVAV